MQGVAGGHQAKKRDAAGNYNREFRISLTPYSGHRRPMHTQALRLLRQALDNNAAQFRDGQWPAIAALVEQRSRLLVVQRTGWGKSLVYFLATR